MMFVHLKVHEWSKEVLRELKLRWSQFREHVTCPLYAIADVADVKWEKFISFFGFTFLNEVICENGEKRRLFVSQAVKENNNDRKQSDADAVDQPDVCVEPLGSPGLLPDPGVPGRV